MEVMTIVAKLRPLVAKRIIICCLMWRKEDIRDIRNLMD